MNLLASLLLTLALLASACGATSSSSGCDEADLACVCAEAELACGQHAHCAESSAGVAECQCNDDRIGNDCEFVRAAVLEEFMYAPDPTEWSRDEASGVAYRYTTVKEREANGWQPGTFLVEASTPIDDFAASSPEVRLLIPMTSTTTRNLDLVWNTTDTGQSFIEVGGGEPGGDLIKTGTPLFNIYASKFVSNRTTRDHMGAVMVGVGVVREPGFLTLGYVEREGASGMAVDRLRVSGPGTTWHIDPIPGAELGGADLLAVGWAPNEQPMEQIVEETAQDLCGFPLPNADDPLNPNNHPCGGGSGGAGGGNGPQPVNQCTNIGDDDGDGSIDVDGYAGGQGTFDPDSMCQHSDGCDPGNGRPYHDHTKESGLDYGLLGSVVWCTRNKDTWEADMYARAAFNNNVFHTTIVAGEDGDGNDDYNAFLGASNHELMRWRASKCWMLPSVQDAESCRYNASDCGVFAPGSEHEYPYGGLRSPRVNFSDYIGASYEDVAHAVQLPLPYNSLDMPLDLWQVVVHENDDNDDLWGGTADDRHGVVVNGAQLNAGLPHPYKSSPHEFGHVFGCEHCDTDYVDKPNGGIQPKGHSIMVTGAAGDSCSASNSGDLAMRFGTACSLRMINGSTELNQFNRRSGPAGGPSFGF